MPRYFFDVAEGRKRVRQVARAEFSDDDMAKAYALGLAETLMQSDDEGGKSTLNVVIIRNDDGDVVEVVQAERGIGSTAGR